LSKCFIGSNQKSKATNDGNKGFETLSLTCITCHNPHISVKETGVQIFNNACLKCHTDKACTETPQQLKLAQNDCVSCHMPQSGSIDIPHVSVHDHKIGIPVTKKELSDIKVFEGLYCVNKSKTDDLFKAAAYLNYYEKFDGEKLALDSAEQFLKPLQSDQSSYLRIHQFYLQENWNRIIQLVQTEIKKPELIADAWTNYRIGQAFQNIGDINNALLFVSKASDLAKANLEFKNKKAILFIQKGDLTTANSLLEESLKLNPKQTEPWINLGFSHLQNGAIEKAFACYKKALALDPDHPQALLNLAALYNLKGDKKLASEQLKKILKRNPDNKEVKNLLNTLI
jgi:tetratricopeptide (TPR) repeat protein